MRYETLESGKPTEDIKETGAIALSYPPRVRVRATVKLSVALFHNESSITVGGYESAIAPNFLDLPS